MGGLTFGKEFGHVRILRPGGWDEGVWGGGARRRAPPPYSLGNVRTYVPTLGGLEDCGSEQGEAASHALHDCFLEPDHMYAIMSCGQIRTDRTRTRRHYFARTTAPLTAASQERRAEETLLGSQPWGVEEGT
jgi:hypothetical protein